MKNSKKILTSVLAAVLAAGSFAGCEKETKLTETDAADAESAQTADSAEVQTDLWPETKHELRFGEDGEFKILVISDTHASGTSILPIAKKNIKILVDREQPDLVMFDGDNTWGVTKEDNLKKCITDFTEYIESKQIPWGHVYGNHDEEGNNLKKEVQQEIYESFEYCVSMAGDEELSGVGNYVLPVYAAKEDRVVFNVWALDSGNYLTGEESAMYKPAATTYQGYEGSSYAYIRPNQIQWYVNTSAAMEEYSGAKIPGLMVFHIPLQESYNAWVNRSALPHTGEKREVVCASEINSGLFAAMAERGDIKAVVNGHDHVNDYMVEYGGIKLCYASTVGNNAYYDEDMLGGRVFVINEEDPFHVKTYMSYVDETKMAESMAEYERLNAVREPLPSGTGVDFDSFDPDITKCGWNNDNSAGAHTDQIRIETADGKGLDGTAALAVTRTQFHGSNTGNNAEATWTMETGGLLGENKYVRVWMDLTGDGTPIDFRKACFGLIADGAVGLPFNTDDCDTPTPFYYMADGTDNWAAMSHGGDGCFGAAEGSSVRGYKGWFAFPVEYMYRRSSGAAPTENTAVTGFYLYFCLNSSEMAGKNFYIDNCMLVKDYKVFD